MGLLLHVCFWCVFLCFPFVRVSYVGVLCGCEVGMGVLHVCFWCVFLCVMCVCVSHVGGVYVVCVSGRYGCAACVFLCVSCVPSVCVMCG